MKSVKVLLVWMLLFWKTRLVGSESEYAVEYTDWKNKAMKEYGSFIKDAEHEIDSKGIEDDKKHAAYVANIYTQNCLYEELNRGMWQNSLSPTMQLFANLMYKAFYILGKCRNSLYVYRGESRCIDNLKLETITNKGFTSTSISPKEAYRFLTYPCKKPDCISNKHYKIFMKIYINNGLPLSDYSTFDYEEEILLINGTRLKFTKKITDKVDVKRAMSGLGLSEQQISNVDIFVEATQTGGRRKRSTVTCGSSSISTGEMHYKLIILYVTVLIHGHVLINGNE